MEGRKLKYGRHDEHDVCAMDSSCRKSSKPLTVLAVGYASSAHVQARVRCFAELGHRVLLVSETPSKSGILGVTELVPALSRELRESRTSRLLFWLCRSVLSINPDHVWRAIVFLNYLRTHRPDIVHIHYAYSYYGWMAGVLGCSPLVVTVMGGDILFDEQGMPTAKGKWLTLNLLKRANYITSKSNYLSEALERLAGLGCKTERIFWGIPLDHFRRVDPSGLRAQLGIETNRRVILSPRSFQPMYRIHLLVEAMPHVIACHPESLLLLTEYAVDADYRAKIISRIEDLGLQQHVRLCGSVSHAAMRDYYSMADVAVSVPESDGMPQTLLEAMACGTPNLLVKLQCYEEIVRHEESAYLVEPTAVSIAAGITRLLRCTDLCEKIARNGLAIVSEEADLGEQARRVERRYYQLREQVPRKAVSLLHLVRTGVALHSLRGGREVRG
jgi:glycosyltransferase involved in cell wall biosynthesis